jgi:hypothetical protein
MLTLRGPNKRDSSMSSPSVQGYIIQGSQMQLDQLHALKLHEPRLNGPTTRSLPNVYGANLNGTTAIVPKNES